ncbi:ribosome silencing factor [Psittacicella melopsittaci]|uniref:Ribosomal silencing factor RsfS n=2 Tax=Psittacicella melopsittaci TaxID=2028576 RepID=A0A3A1Y3K9_9GAMM|nr:ribosome silencing factor [Psittacicella melopsittaci]RIY32010.1 ribosome silencing factor [Psittacicella melopsittaci]
MLESQEQMCSYILDKLDDLKAQEPCEINVVGKSSVTDTMIIVTGTSDRHCGALAEHLIDEMKKAGVESFGSEGRNTGDWIVVDFGSVMVHIMQDEARKSYELEKLWA